MKLRKLKKLKEHYLSAFTLKMLIAASLATIIAIVLSFTLKETDFAKIYPEFVFIPWGIVLIVSVSLAFQQGALVKESKKNTQKKKK